MVRSFEFEGLMVRKKKKKVDRSIVRKIEIGENNELFIQLKWTTTVSLCAQQCKKIIIRRSSKHYEEVSAEHEVVIINIQGVDWRVIAHISGDVQALSQEMPNKCMWRAGKT